MYLKIEEFVSYFEYVRLLQFDECPNYEYLKELFRSIMKNNEYKNDYNFDWNKSISKKVFI